MRTMRITFDEAINFPVFYILGHSVLDGENYFSANVLRCTKRNSAVSNNYKTPVPTRAGIGGRAKLRQRNVFVDFIK